MMYTLANIMREISPAICKKFVLQMLPGNKGMHVHGLGEQDKNWVH